MQCSQGETYFLRGHNSPAQTITSCKSALKERVEGLPLYVGHTSFPCLLNTSSSIFCESIAFFVVKACERRVAFSKLPRVLHHESEVVIAINGAAHSLVVLAELLEGHDAVGLLAVPLRHEFLEDLLWGLLALDDVGVLARVVDLGDVLQSDLAVLGDIKLVVCEPDPLLAFFIDFSLRTRARHIALE